MADVERTCKVLREQRGVTEARRFAELAVSYCDDVCREAAVMVATELAENIVKYGTTHAGPFAGTISIRLQGRALHVIASNEVASPEDAEAVKEAIARIAASSDVKTLYRSRLADLFKNPELPRAQLGLLRAAYEGGFRLSCKYEAPTLVVSAERSCDIQ